LLRIGITSAIVFMTAGLSQADPYYELNHAYNVRRASNLYVNGYVDIKGQIVPAPTAAGQPPVRSGTFRTGVFGLEFENPPYVPFAAVCIDANENLFASGSTLYYIQTLASFPSFGPFTDGPTPTMTADRKRKLQQLYTVAWKEISGSTDSTDSAAFQWAVWEIARENAATLNVATDGVKITGASAGISTMNGVTTRANQFLSWIDPLRTPETPLAIWSPVQKLADGSYARIKGQELLTLAPVPEAQLHGLLAAAVGIVIVCRKRRRARLASQGQQA
jgi:hypothetical protein